MNYRKTGIPFRKERIARDLINKLPLNCWVYFKDIPNNIRFELIEILDSYYLYKLESEFDETSTKFKITKL